MLIFSVQINSLNSNADILNIIFTFSWTFIQYETAMRKYL